jgi:hypothetical protein
MSKYRRIIVERLKISFQTLHEGTQSNEKKLTAVKAGCFLAGSPRRQFSPTCWRPVRGNRRTRIRIRRINKSKAVPLQAWKAPEGSRKLRLSDFMTAGT